MQLAQIVNNRLVNIVEVDPNNIPAWAEGYVDVTGIPNLKLDSIYDPDTNTFQLPERYRPENILLRRRQRMMTHRRAFFKALLATPVTVSPFLANKFPDATSVLEAIDAQLNTMPKYHPIKMMLKDITQFQRMHQDMIDFQALLGITDEDFDTLFDLAAELTNGNGGV